MPSRSGLRASKSGLKSRPVQSIPDLPYSEHRKVKRKTQKLHQLEPNHSAFHLIRSDLAISPMVTNRNASNVQRRQRVGQCLGEVS